jgi:nucleoside-diphosphate-sugar epimerase
MKTAITGATGFIGKYMVRGVLAAGHDVRVLRTRWTCPTTPPSRCSSAT